MSNEIPSDVRRKINARDEARCLVCGAVGTEIQHRIRRREGGHRMSNLMRVCTTCHRKIHAEPMWAMENGFTASAVMDVDPQGIALRSFKGWITLKDDGCVVVIAPRGVAVADLGAYGFPERWLEHEHDERPVQGDTAREKA